MTAAMHPKPVRDENSVDARGALNRISERSAARTRRSETMAFEGPNGSMIAPNSGPGPLPPTRPLAHAASNVSVEVFVDEDARETGPGAAAAAMLATPAAPWRSLPTVAEKTKENAGVVSTNWSEAPLPQYPGTHRLPSARPPAPAFEVYEDEDVEPAPKSQSHAAPGTATPSLRAREPRHVSTAEALASNPLLYHTRPGANSGAAATSSGLPPRASAAPPLPPSASAVGAASASRKRDRTEPVPAVGASVGPGAVTGGEQPVGSAAPAPAPAPVPTTQLMADIGAPGQEMSFEELRALAWQRKHPAPPTAPTASPVPLVPVPDPAVPAAPAVPAGVESTDDIPASHKKQRTGDVGTQQGLQLQQEHCGDDGMTFNTRFALEELDDLFCSPSAKAKTKAPPAPSAPAPQPAATARVEVDWSAFEDEVAPKASLPPAAVLRKPAALAPTTPAPAPPGAPVVVDWSLFEDEVVPKPKAAPTATQAPAWAVFEDDAPTTAPSVKTATRPLQALAPKSALKPLAFSVFQDDEAENGPVPAVPAPAGSSVKGLRPALAPAPAAAPAFEIYQDEDDAR